MKKHVWWLAAMLIIVTLLPGVQARSVVEYWYTDNSQSPFWETMTSLVEKFNQSQQEVTVQLSTFIWDKNFQAKLLSAIVGGSAPDVVAIDGSAVIEWVANSNAFQPLDQLLPKYGIHKDDFIPHEWREGSLWGKQWSVPFRTASRGLYWNKDMLREAGINADRAPATLEDLDAIAAKITRINPDTKQLVQLGFAPWLNNWNLQGWFWSFGGSLFDWERARYTINRPEHLRALRWAKEYADRYPQAITFNQGYSGNNERFFRNELGFILQSTTYLSRLNQYRADMDYGVGVPPQPQGGANGNWGGGFSHVVPASAKNPEGAVRLIAYLVDPKTQIEFYQATSTLPTCFEAVRRLIQITPDLRTRIMIEGLPYANARTPYWLTVHNNLVTANSELINGKKTPEAILLEQQAKAEQAAVNLTQH